MICSCYSLIFIKKQLFIVLNLSYVNYVYCMTGWTFLVIDTINMLHRLDSSSDLGCPYCHSCVHSCLSYVVWEVYVCMCVCLWGGEVCGHTHSLTKTQSCFVSWHQLFGGVKIPKAATNLFFSRPAEFRLQSSISLVCFSRLPGAASV